MRKMPHLSSKGRWFYDKNKNSLYLGDCLEVLANFEADSFDLIMTSPRYADRRAQTYGGVNPEWGADLVRMFRIG